MNTKISAEAKWQNFRFQRSDIVDTTNCPTLWHRPDNAFVFDGMPIILFFHKDSKSGYTFCNTEKQMLFVKNLQQNQIG